MNFEMHYTRYFSWGILILVPFLMLVSCKSKKPEPSGQGSQKAPTVGGIVIQPRSLENRIMSTGTLIANEEVELHSEIPGRIVSINFTEGTFVNKGDVLVKIDDRELQANLKKLLIDEKQAKDDVYRKKRLLELQAVSQEEYDKIVNSLEVVQAELDLIRTQISKSEITAPFSGLIGLRQVSPGGYISTSTMITRLQQVEPIKIDFSVPEKYQELIKKGTKINFTVAGQTKPFEGTVYAIEPRIDPLTRNMLLRGVCPNPGGVLLAGAFAKVEIVLQNITDALVVPSEAVIPILNGEKVFVTEGGKIKSRDVREGIRTEREVQILSGLNPGDTVVTTGLLQVRDDMKVNVKIIGEQKTQ
jgi:membrane fusion protein, multidrug efflux system